MEYQIYFKEEENMNVRKLTVRERYLSLLAEINKLPHKIVLNVDKVAKEVGSARVANIVLLLSLIHI